MINTADGIHIKNSLLFEIIHFSLGKNNEKAKNAKGATLAPAKLILPQKNFHEGFLTRKIIKMLKFHDASAHERIEKEILIRFWVIRLIKTNKPNPALIKKTKNKTMLVICKYSILRNISV